MRLFYLECVGLVRDAASNIEKMTREFGLV
jgi:hypothetical protein